MNTKRKMLDAAIVKLIRHPRFVDLHIYHDGVWQIEFEQRGSKEDLCYASGKNLPELVSASLIVLKRR